MISTELEEAEAWFHRRGLPHVVRQGGLSTLAVRAAPPMVGVLFLSSMLAVLTAAAHHAAPTAPASTGQAILATAVILALVAVPLGAARVTANLLRRWSKTTQVGAGTALTVAPTLLMPALQAVLHTGSIGSGVPEALVITMATLLLVWCGIGSIISYALRNALGQMQVISQMARRALPLLILVMLATFFAAEIWQMAGSLPRWRLWAVIGLLVALTAMFVGTVQADDLHNILAKAPEVDPATSSALAGTPFARSSMEHNAPPAYTRWEKLDVTLGFFLSRAVQVALFMLVVFVFFLIFGALSVTPETMTSWLTRQPTVGVFFGLQMPVPNELIQVAMFEAAFSGLYFATATATDPQYRVAFHEPLLTDLRASLAGRSIYLSHTSTPLWSPESRRARAGTPRRIRRHRALQDKER